MTTYEIPLQAEPISAGRYRLSWGRHVLEIEAPSHDEAIALAQPQVVATVIRALQTGR